MATPKAKKTFVSTSDKKKQASIFSFFGKKKSTPIKQSVSENKANSPPTSSTKDSLNNDEDVSMATANDTTIVADTTTKPGPSSNDDDITNTQFDTPDSSSQEDNGSSPLARAGARRKLNYSELSDDEEEMVVKSKKRRQNTVVESDSEDDFVPDDDVEDEDDFVPENSKDLVQELDGVDDDEEEDEEEIKDEDDEMILNSLLEEDDVSIPKPKISTKQKFSEKFKASSDYTITKPPTKPKSSNFKNSSSVQKKFKTTNDERYSWLITIKDAEKRLETDPNYDPRTLYVPSSAWAKFTPFEKQYWEIKSKMWDSIVFFKKGKFYELYEKDALLGHTLFDLKLAGTGRANMQLAGVPEMSFDYWASEFIKKGYKVAKVDQKETALAKQINAKDTGKKGPTIIERKLSCVLTAGTLTNEKMLVDDMATYCMSVKQELRRDGSSLFGVAFIDTAVGSIKLLEFLDDSECSNLQTLTNQIKPKEIIVSKNNLSNLAMKILKMNSVNNALWNHLKPNLEFWDFDTTLEKFCQAKYFPSKDLDDRSNWPSIVTNYIENNKQCGFSAFGGLLWYLRSLKLDESLVSMGNIEEYDLYKSINTLILDGQSLQNLEIFNNQFDGSDKGTLFRLLNRCITSFGKRQLKNWVCYPLLNINEINQRLDSVDGLLNNGELMEVIIDHLKELPDLERMLSRIHSNNLKIQDFVKVIQGFQKINKLKKTLINESLPGILNLFFESIPETLEDVINTWENSFDFGKAINEGLIVPETGIEPEFDTSLEKQLLLENQLNDLLRGYKRQFKCQEMVFKDSGKEIYLIECPIKCVKNLPKDWIIMGGTAKFKRYWSPEIKVLVQELMEIRERHKLLVENLKSKFYQKFDENYTMWLNTIKSISNIDCIISLTKTSELLGEPCCRPQFIDSNQGEIKFEELRHPCFINGGVSGTKEFIPNNINLGGNNDANIGLLTGANAAGKSTVLRMTCIAVILAQLGCYVPAISAKLTPIDRIMTRLGANDNLIQGKSTFYVELSETKKILDSATPKSLIVLDELGRGGSSSDGYAIAEAVLYHLATHVQSIGYFATHYGSLGLPFKNHPAIKNLRMAIMVEENSRNVIFLYKLESGSAPGSFGMNVASMCGIQEEIIQNAETAAMTFEHTSRIKQKNQLAKLSDSGIPLGLQSDVAWLVKGGLSNLDNGTGEGCRVYDDEVKKNVLKNIFGLIEGL